MKFMGSVMVLAWGVLSAGAYGDILIGTDGVYKDGQVISQTDREVVWQAANSTSKTPEHLDRAQVKRVILTDDQGALRTSGPGVLASEKPTPRHWDIPPDPEAPAVVKTNVPSYYVIPLHGTVGETILASVLEKSLADAVLRKPTVVVLDIDSPGGMIAEAEKITKVLHRYNKLLRIVALADKDLSAAAVITLSVREIYLKPTGTIGAATAYQPDNPNLAPKIEEKMQSAWRAVARNSAEEGGHEPLLAEGMIDLEMRLHVEKVNGKKLVREGEAKGEEIPLGRKGKILTLTAHEAVECGLAAGDAEDYTELGKALGLENWVECKGLGTLLAENLPKRLDYVDKEAKKILGDFLLNVKEAVNSDPTSGNYTRTIISQAQNPTYLMQPGMRSIPQFGPRTINPGGPPGAPPNPRFSPMVPSPPISVPTPGFPSPGMIPVPAAPGMVTQTEIISSDVKPRWKQRSLAFVVAILDAERNIRDLISLSNACGLTDDMSALEEAATNMATARAKVYANRNKFAVNEERATATTVPVRKELDPGQLPEGLQRTNMVGGKEGKGFIRLNPQQHMATSLVTRRIDSRGQKSFMALELYDEATDNRFVAKDDLVVAKPGYVVGGLTVNADDHTVNAIQVVFIRNIDGILIPSDQYTSPWMGKRDLNCKEVTLAGKGETVVGVCGQRDGLRIISLGLIIRPR